MITQGVYMLVLEIEDIKKLVNHIGYQRFFKELMQTLKEDYSAWHRFDKIPRIASHVKDGVIELMPVCNETLYSFKYVNGHPKNPKNNNLTVMATGQLSEVKTGKPLLFCEMTLLTALRTAATSALAASYLAPKTSTVLAFIGTGAQSEFQYLAFREIFDIQQLRYYDIDEKAMQKFAQNLKAFDVELIACQSAKEAVQGAHIITTMTADKANRTILTKDMISQPVFINGIGGDCPGKTELEKKLVEASTVVVEYLEQSKIEGEIQQMSDDYVCTQLYEIITGQSRINVTTHGTVIFDSVGFALEDFSILRYVYQLATRLNIGAHLDLIPQLQDVKNLYSLLKNEK